MKFSEKFPMTLLKAELFFSVVSTFATVFSCLWTRACLPTS